MSLDLFDFDFTEVNNNLLTEDRISKQFLILQKLFKKKRNSYYVRMGELPRDMIVFIDEFEKKGWIVRRGDGVNILDEYLIYHTPEEVASEFQRQMDRALANPDVSWYENVLTVINRGASPIRYKDEKTKKEIWRLEKEIIKNSAIKLGLKHFIEVPSSRGHKMNPFSSKWSKENVLPMIVELIIPITDYDEMEDFFNTHVFFMGRRDWDRSGYNDDYNIPPYPEFKKICPSSFELACLCEAKDFKHVELVLEYSGSATGSIYNYVDVSNEQSTNRYIHLFPSGWSMERYNNSLTEKDKELIRLDHERLARLHSK